MRISVKILFKLSVIGILMGFSMPCFARVHMSSDNMGLGIPLGGRSEPVGLEKNPQAVYVVRQFLLAWERQDWDTMYQLLDPGVREEYPFEQAQFDFKFLEYRPYEISMVTRSGDNFEFLLSHGDWAYGDKTNRKMVISGKTNLILMPSENSPFKRSFESYF